MKVMVLGSTGLLGCSVGKHFKEKNNFETFLTYRSDNISYGENKIYFDAIETPLTVLPKVDYLINCIGIIKPFMHNDKEKNIYINSVFPHKLSKYCKKNNIKLIHITTDCVFSGKDGNYDENSYHDCLDVYGKSKSLGEPNDCMLLRTSIIGEEIHKNASLIEWAKSMKGETIDGYVNHLWNGVTTKHYAELCEKIITNNLYEESLFHIHSNVISKCDLLQMINDKFKLDLNIRQKETDISINRSLSTIKQLNNKLNVKPLEQQIREL